MSEKKDLNLELTVVWQSLVVPAYRRFFAELARHNSGSIHLVAPKRFRELGSQWLACAPADSERYHLHILPIWFWHVQIVFFRGFASLWRRIGKNSTGRKQALICLAEPYSLTALFVYLQTCISGRKPDYFILYGLQNIDKKHPLLLRWVQNFLFKRATHILYTGDEQAYVLQRQGYRGATLPFPLWFDEETFKIDTIANRSQYEYLDAKKIWLGYAGSLLPEKGLQDLFAALYALSEDLRQDVCMLVAGQGPMAQTVQDSLHELEKVGIQTLYLGALSSTAMQQFYNVIDFLLVPSRTTHFWKEQFGRVIVEAEACGAMALGSDSGAIPEVIGDSQRIFKEQNPDSLRTVLQEQISQLLTAAPAERVLRRERMRARALHRYGDKKLAERFAEKLGEKLASRR